MIVNYDNDLLHWWVNQNEYNPIITFGIHERSDYQACNISYDLDGTTYKVNNKKVFVPVIGDAFIYNSLVAFIIGDLYQVDYEKICEVLKNLKREPHRMEFITHNDYTIIDDTYNASYDSVVYSLDVLSRLKGRKIAVLGDILELGEFSEDIHRKIGKYLAGKPIDYLVTVGSMSCYIEDEATKNGFSL